MMRCRHLASGLALALTATAAVMVVGTGGSHGAAPAPALASCDDPPPPEPELTALSIDTDSVDVRDASQTITVTGSANGSQITEVWIQAKAIGKRGSGSWANGRISTITQVDETHVDFVTRLKFPKYIRDGNWRIDSVHFWYGPDGDNVGTNVPSGLAQHLTVASDPDTTKPRVDALTFSKHAVDTRKRSASVVVSGRVKDDKSGVTYVSVSLHQNRGRDLHLYSRNVRFNGGKFTGRITFPQGLGSLPYVVWEVGVGDRGGNYKYYGGYNRNLPKRFKRTFTLRGQFDDTGPKIKSVRVRPQTVVLDDSPTVSITVKATDDLAGVEFVDVQLTKHGNKPNGGPSVTVYRPSGGRWQGTVNMTSFAGCWLEPGEYDVWVRATDRTSNETDGDRRGYLKRGKVTVVEP